MRQGSRGHLPSRIRHHLKRRCFFHCSMRSASPSKTRSVALSVNWFSMIGFGVVVDGGGGAYEKGEFLFEGICAHGVY